MYSQVQERENMIMQLEDKLYILEDEVKNAKRAKEESQMHYEHQIKQL